MFSAGFPSRWFSWLPIRLTFEKSKRFSGHWNSARMPKHATVAMLQRLNFHHSKSLENWLDCIFDSRIVMNWVKSEMSVVASCHHLRRIRAIPSILLKFPSKHSSPARCHNSITYNLQHQKKEITFFQSKSSDKFQLFTVKSKTPPH